MRASVIPGHSVPLAGLGALMMYAGLASLTAGAGRGMLNAVLAGAAGIVASLFGRITCGRREVSSRCRRLQPAAG